MPRAHLSEVQLDYEVIGRGEPLLLIHGAHIADAMKPLAVEPILGGYKRILFELFVQVADALSEQYRQGTRLGPSTRSSRSSVRTPGATPSTRR